MIGRVRGDVIQNAGDLTGNSRLSVDVFCRFTVLGVSHCLVCVPLRVRTLSDGPMRDIVLEAEIHSKVGERFTKVVQF